MRGRLRSATGHRTPLVTGWELAAAAAGSIDTPEAAASLAWMPIEAPTTVAAALQAKHLWNLEAPARRFDAEDWWYRVRFPAPSNALHTILGFDGLATVAEGWLNGQPLLSSDNMFVAHELAIDGLLKAENELVLRFRSLDALLAAKRPRPRWRAPMIENQQLRWFRTTLLGRTPGWSPPATAVGPWRPIWLETRVKGSATHLSLRSTVQDTTGTVEVRCETNGQTPPTLRLTRNGKTHSATLERTSERASKNVFSARLDILSVDLWWPHTHGEPALYDAKLAIGDIEIDLGPVGFRTVTLDTAGGNFALAINGVPVFCRGACWTPLDCVSLHGAAEEYDTAIAQVKAAGMNMLRVGGTMVYESDDFYDACDRHGILLWQEFMFANMDYPEADAAFDASVKLETQQLLQRLSGRPCLTVLCGNSEVEQQAAMWGATRERWTHPLFHRLLPEQTKVFAPDVPYWPSSAHGGAFPHQGNAGTTSYYGVGAYRRPLTDARRAEIRFATECLGFANIPEDSTRAAMPGGLSLKVHHPQWKARSPRDLGAGWDFDDVRDHYLAELFGVQPLDLRYADHERYLEWGRLATGEVMASAFREWRRQRSSCNGALIWFLRDLWPGAGWGIVDAKGLPKSPYYFLKRVLQPRAVFLSDEGGNGVFAHLANESAHDLNGYLEISLYRAGEVSLGNKRQSITVPARATLELSVAGMLDGFMDVSYAYRFGPPACDLVIATLRDENDTILSQDFYFPTGAAFSVEPDVGLTATAQPLPDGDVEVTVHAKRLARYVTVQAEGFRAAEQYFHIAPGMAYLFRLHRLDPNARLKGHLRAANSAASCTFVL